MFLGETEKYSEMKLLKLFRLMTISWFHLSWSVFLLPVGDINTCCILWLRSKNKFSVWMRCIDAIQHGSAAIQGKRTQHESGYGGFKHRLWQLDDWQKHQNSSRVCTANTAMKCIFLHLSLKSDSLTFNQSLLGHHSAQHGVLKSVLEASEFVERKHLEFSKNGISDWK